MGRNLVVAIGLASILLVQITGSLSGKCQRQINHATGLGGTIESPGYPQNYSPVQTCIWHIAVKKGFRVHIHFEPRFDVARTPYCRDDYVLISTRRQRFSDYRVFRSGKDSVLFCGNEKPSNVTSPANELWIRFKSKIGGHTGFRVSYGADDIDECSELLNGGCHQDCVNTQGSFKCTCRPGFRLVSNERDCIEDVVISFSKRRYRTSLSVKAAPGASFLTVRARADNTQIPIRYSIRLINNKPYRRQTALFEVDPVTGTFSVREKLKKKAHYRLRVEARISDDIFASTSVIIRVEAANKILSADPDQSLRFPSPIYSVIIPFNTPVGQTILHLRVEKSKRRSNSVVRYRINSFDPYQKKALFSLDPWKGSLKISRELPQLDSPYDKPVNFVLQVVARTQENERNTLTAATRVSIVVVPEYAGNDYVQSSLAVVKNTSEAVDSSRRLRFNKSATSRERTEFSLHRMFRRLSPEAKRLSKADLRFCEIIRELKREVADHLLDDRSRKGAVSVRLGPSSIASAGKLSEIVKEANCSFPEANCSDTEYHSKYRTFDGTCNNLENPLWGAAATPFTRMLDPVYYDSNGLSDPVGFPDQPFAPHLPSPHLVSKVFFIHLKEGNRNNKRYSHMLMQWGQFLDHDISFTAESEGSEKCFLPNCDGSAVDFEPPCYPIMYPDGSSCTMFTRSAAACQTDNENITPREQLNTITAFIDGSQIYGSSSEVAQRLRDLNSGRGLLKISRPRYLLPFVETPFDPPLNLCQRFGGCFDAGDFRVNEQIALASMHTLWIREHNRIAESLSRLNKHWDTEKVYHETRKIVGAVLQHITYNHYLPKILGNNALPAYRGYENIHPGILNVFATSAFRFGHSMVRPKFAMLDANYDPVAPDVLLRNAFFNNKLVQREGIEPVLLGLLANESLAVNREMAAGLTKHLFQQPESDHGFDLAALNIQRGRDHGLPGYGAWRRECNLSHADIFQETNFEIINATSRQILHELYEDVEYADLWVSGLAEDPIPGAIVGPTLHCILKEQFRRLRDGDRFWFERNGVFSDEQVKEVRKTSLSRVLCDNIFGIVSVQRDAFIAATDELKRVECTDIRQMDLSKWKENQPSPHQTFGSWSDWVYTVRKSTGSWAVAKAGDLCPGSVVDVECQLADGSPAKLAGQVIHCKERIGVYCRNSEQLGNDPVCADFRFRFLCADIEKPHPHGSSSAQTSSTFEISPKPQCDTRRYPTAFSLPFEVAQHVTISHAYKTEPLSQYMIAGKKKGQSKMRFLMSFDTRKIPRRAIVHSAKLYIYLVDFAASNGANEPSVVYSNSLEVYQIISTDWHPENTTSVIPWHQNFLGIGKDVAKNRLAESDNLQPGERQRWVHLDVQHAFRNWQIRQQPNYGLMLKIKKEYSANAVMKFASSDHPLEHLHPKLKVCLTIHPW